MTARRPDIGFIGLGRMGGPMAALLARAGHGVRGFDISAAARDRLAAAGGTPVASPGEAVAPIVILMLPDSAAVDSVVRSGAFAAALRPGTLIIDMSSSEPTATRALAGDLAKREIRLADAPVSGGVRGAEAGRLTIMVGAGADDFPAVADCLAPLGKVIHAGGVGAGHAVKALNNLLSATHLLVTSEAMAAGIRFGLSPEVMLAIFNASSGKSGSTENKWPNFILTERYDSGFAFNLMVKDMTIATRLARHLGTGMALGERAVGLWEAARAALPPDADHTEIARWTLDDGDGSA
ncbi:NAD(P)-dependent oxidoreductase [Zavarzinia compransoris]|uniref:NAD(P)-dependent oxidoreductase n=1 Tax=Zavarzinia compransoris TaxID=1264899 RepID=A0A317E8P0_9PROT|nr:NAD(P)-dependent oxidoreductase [Zavarzinia compransoris]PWR21653.1 NAD(P)-dependent oxidoreductase [Zavarzinia compransoris]TDP45566.1 3-hydroxyisobutyrate dehydrogenase [Zavarzinia compransoris]